MTGFKKKYPLIIESCGEHYFAAYSKGHHDEGHFIDTVKRVYPQFDLARPIHLWCINVFGKLHFSKAKQKKYFPVTYVEENKDDKGICYE